MTKILTTLLTLLIMLAAGTNPALARIGNISIPAVPPTLACHPSAAQCIRAIHFIFRACWAW